MCIRLGLGQNLLVAAGPNSWFSFRKKKVRNSKAPSWNLIAEAKRATTKNIAIYIIVRIPDKRDDFPWAEYKCRGVDTDGARYEERQQNYHKLTQIHQKSKERTIASIRHVAS